MKIDQWNKDNYVVVGLSLSEWIIVNKETCVPFMETCTWMFESDAQDALDSLDKLIKEYR